MGWLCLRVQKIRGWKKESTGCGGKPGTISFGSSADFRWVFSRREIARCPVTTSLQVLVPCPGQGAVPSRELLCKAIATSSATAVFMVYFETVVFKSGHSVMGAARRHHTTWKGSRSWCKGSGGCRLVEWASASSTAPKGSMLCNSTYPFFCFAL